MSRRRDEEDEWRWARQDRDKKARLDAWLVGRTDGGRPVKPPLEHAIVKDVRLYHDAFADTDVSGELVALEGMSLPFKAAFGRTSNGYEFDWSRIVILDVRMVLNGDPRHSWHEWTKAKLTDAEQTRIERGIITTFAERNRAEENTQTSSGSRQAPWEPGPLERPGSPHLDPNVSENWSREALQERAAGKALLRKGRDRYGDDWYPGKYVN